MPTRVFIPLLLPFLILIGIAVYAEVTPYSSTNLPPPGQRGSLVWGDGIFANETEFRAWLRLHGGGSFQRWAKHHPAALSLVRPRPHRTAVPAKAKVKKPARAQKAAPAAVTAVPAVSTTSTTTKTPGWMRWIFTALGLLLALGAIAAPSRFVGRLVTGPVRSDRDMRLAIAGAAIAVLGGVAMAVLLG
jgi:hypothetical protein